MKEAAIPLEKPSRSQVQDRAGDRFEDLYQANAARAEKFAYILTGDQHAAEDLVQEAFVRLFGRFRDRQPPDLFEQYLRRTLINLSRNRFRKRAREQDSLVKSGSEAITASSARLEDEVALWHSILSLPVRSRAVIYLRYYEDFDLDAIARALDCSVGAVKSLLQRSKKKLEEMERRQI